MAAPRDVYEEGALIFPAVQVQRDYEDIDDIIRMCEMRIRVPGAVVGRLPRRCSARRGSASASCSRSADEVGWDALDELAEHWFDYCERRMVGGDPARCRRAAVVGHAAHDPFPGAARRRADQGRGRGRPGAAG